MHTTQTIQTAQTIALTLNNCKHSFINFTLEQLSQFLKKENCPYWSKIPTILIEKNIIEKNYKSFYNFISESPIYYGIIESGIHKINNKQKTYNEKWKKKNFYSDEEKAIILLKSLGYKIIKEF